MINPTFDATYTGWNSPNRKPGDEHLGDQLLAELARERARIVDELGEGADFDPGWRTRDLPHSIGYAQQRTDERRRSELRERIGEAADAVTVQQAAVLAGMSVSAINGLVARGRLSFVLGENPERVTGGRRLVRLIPRADLDALVEARTSGEGTGSQTPSRTELGTFLGQARQAQGLSARQVARALGCSKTAWLRWERGEVAPSLGYVSTIIAVLGLDAHQRQHFFTLAEQARRHGK